MGECFTYISSTFSPSLGFFEHSFFFFLPHLDLYFLPFRNVTKLPQSVEAALESETRKRWSCLVVQFVSRGMVKKKKKMAGECWIFIADCEQFTPRITQTFFRWVSESQRDFPVGLYARIYLHSYTKKCIFLRTCASMFSGFPNSGSCNLLKTNGV